MHQLKHIVENGGANTAERCHEGVLQVVCSETGWPGKNKCERKCKESKKKRLKTIHLGVVQDREQVGHESCPTLQLFSLLLSGTQVACKHFESGLSLILCTLH